MQDNPAKICLISSRNTENAVSVVRMPFIIGSAASADLRIEDPHISDPHACIVLKDGAYYLFDLSSRNGTYIVDSERQDEGVFAVPSLLDISELANATYDESGWLTPGTSIAFATQVWIVGKQDENYQPRDQQVEVLGQNPSRVRNREQSSDELALEVVAGPEIGRYISISTFPFIIGSSSKKSDLVFEGCDALSRAHITFLKDEKDRICVEDLHSRNGTQLNGKHLQERYVLHNDDVLTLARQLSVRVHMKPDGLLNARRVFWGIMLSGFAIICGSILYLRSGQKEKEDPVVPQEEEAVVYEKPWRAYLGAYERALPGLTAELGSLGEKVNNENWDALTNGVTQLASILSITNDFVMSSAAVLLWRNEHDHKDDLVARLVDYGDKLWGGSVKSDILAMIRSGELTKARETLEAVDKIVYWAELSDLLRETLFELESLTGLDASTLKSPYYVNQHWSNGLDRLSKLLVQEPEIRDAVDISIDRARERLIENLRARAMEEVDPMSRLRILRLAQMIREDHPGVSRDIYELQPVLEPVFRGAIFGTASKEERKALAEITRESDWTKPYYERLK